MKMDAAERVSPQGSLSFFRLPHHFVVGLASLCHDSSHDLPLSAAPLHPSTRSACQGPRFWRLGAWQKPTSRSTGTHALEQYSVCQRATLYGTEPCIFKVKTSRASNPRILECWISSTLIVASFRRQYAIWYHFFVVQRGRWRQVTFLPEPEFAR